MVKDVTTEEFDEIIESGKKVFVDFYANWCGPCKMVEPVIKELATTFEGQIEFVKVNVDEEPDVAARYGVRSIPTFYVLEKTSILFKHMGASPKTFFEQKIREILK